MNAEVCAKCIRSQGEKLTVSREELRSVLQLRYKSQ